MRTIEIEYQGETFIARPMSARHASVVVKLAEAETTEASLKTMEYVVLCCLMDGDRPKYTDEQKDEIRNLPFSFIKTVSEAVFAEAGLSDKEAGN